MTTAAQGLSPRTAKRSAREATMASPDANSDSATKHHGIRPIEGLSWARIACGRFLLRLRANPTALLVLPAVIVMIMIVMNISKKMPIKSIQKGVPFLPHPLMVQTMENDSVVHQLHVQDYRNKPLEEREFEHEHNHGIAQYKDRSRVKEGCTALGEWQDTFHPSCNAFHEVSMGVPVHEDGWEMIRLVNNGAYRDVWGIRDFDGKRRVLKTLRYVKSRKFDLRNFDRHRRDAVASEQLAASPYIVDIYGYCSNSALTDYCEDGDLFDVKEVLNPSKNEMLKIAYDVAASVADAHHYDDKGRATIAHTDLKPNQWIYLDGRYQLNDFNRCRFLSWNVDKDEVCGFEVARNAGLWRAPEEYNYEKETEKLDVFSLGNVLYFLLTDRAPLDEMDSDEAMDLIAKGGRVNVTEKEILRSTHPFDTTILKALDMCFISDPKQRATAREVADFIKGALDRIKQED